MYRLSSGRYYFEFLEKAFDGSILAEVKVREIGRVVGLEEGKGMEGRGGTYIVHFVNMLSLQWKTPLSEEYVSIPSSSFTMAAKCTSVGCAVLSGV